MGSSADLSVIAMLARLVEQRRRIGLFGLYCAVAIVVVTVLPPRRYAARTALTSSAGAGGLGAFAGLAAQFGVNLPSSTSEAPPAYFAHLLSSRPVVESAVRAEYDFPVRKWYFLGRAIRSQRADLTFYFDVSGDELPERIDRAVEQLRRRLAVEHDVETGVVSAVVRLPDANLAAAILSNVVEAVDSLNVEVRRAKVSAERKFVEEQLRTSRLELRRAEDELRLFLERNRSFAASPELQFEYERLQREVGLRFQVSSALAQSFEQSRIEEVRDTPVLSVVEPVQVPARPMRRKLLLKAALGFAFGCAAASMLLLVVYAQSSSAQGEGELRRLIDRLPPRLGRLIETVLGSQRTSGN